MTPSGSAAPDESQALGLDIGTTNTKAALVAVDRSSGRVQVLARAAAPTPAPGDLPNTLARLLGSIRRDRPDARVQAIGIASMAETGVPLGSDRRPLGGWLRWDARIGAGQVAGLSASLGLPAVFAATGVRLAGKTPLAVWAALRQSEPDRFRAMRAWAGAADLAGLALTGELVTDHTLAGRTGAYRLPTGAVWPQVYAADLLEAVGLSPRQMPLISTPRARRVTGAAARWAESGIAPGTPVVIAGHDHAVGAWAAGVRQPGQAADSIGTAEAIYLVLRSPAGPPAAPPPDPERVRQEGMSLAATVDGGLALIAGHSAAGGAVAAWLAEHAPGLDPDGLGALAATARPGQPDLFVLPYPGGRQCPRPDPAAGLRLVEARPHSPAERAAGLFEGLALHAAWMLREGARLGGLEPGGVALLGGPALANPVWMAAKRALTPDLAVVAAAEPVAAGAAIFALVNAAPGAAVDDRGPARPAPGRPPGADRRPAPTGDWGRRLDAFVDAATAERPLTEEEP